MDAGPAIRGPCLGMEINTESSEKKVGVMEASVLEVCYSVTLRSKFWLGFWTSVKEILWFLRNEMMNFLEFLSTITLECHIFLGYHTELLTLNNRKLLT